MEDIALSLGNLSLLGILSTTVTFVCVMLWRLVEQFWQWFWPKFWPNNEAKCRTCDKVVAFCSTIPPREFPPFLTSSVLVRRRQMALTEEEEGDMRYTDCVSPIYPTLFWNEFPIRSRVRKMKWAATTSTILHPGGNVGFYFFKRSFVSHSNP